MPYNWKNSTLQENDGKTAGGVDRDSCYRIEGVPGKDKYLKVTTNLGSAQNSFVLSGWVKSETTPIRSGRDFKVTAYHTEENDGVTTTLSLSNNINAYSEGWKYFTMIIPAASWKSTTFTIRFYDNIGDLYIDGLQLTRNDIQTKKYDSAGRVTTRYTTQKSTSYTYDSCNRLKTQTSAAGAKSTYTYSKTNDTTRIAASIGPDTYMTYDEYGKVISNSLDGNTITKYVYDNDGNVAKKTDALAGVTTKYDYNDANMLVRSEVYDGETTASEALESRMQYTYTKSGQVGTLSYQEKDDDIRTYTYTYAADEKPVKSTLPDLSYTSWTYDSLRRNTKIVHTPKDGASDSKKLYTVLEYKEAEYTTADDKTKTSKTGLVDYYVNKFGSSGDAVSEFRYTYDEWGNITFINDIVVNGEEGYYVVIGELDNVVPAPETGDELENTIFSTDDSTVSNATGVRKESSALDYGRRYTYNDLGEVLTASETYADKTTTKYAYTYDEGGNILTETIDGTVHTYAYDGTWKDKLVSYDGKAITYDVFGCPLDYMGTAMTWDIYGGLTSVDNGTDSITYTYMVTDRDAARLSTA